jgi:hypothetical protein
MNLAILILAPFLTITAINGWNEYLRAEARGQAATAIGHYNDCRKLLSGYENFIALADCERGLGQEVAHIWFPAEAEQIAREFVTAQDRLDAAIRTYVRAPNDFTVSAASQADQRTSQLWAAVGLVTR